MRKLLVFGVLVAVVPRAVADPAARATARKAAEQLATDAQATHDDAKFVACGQAFLDIYNQDPQAPDDDEALYNAAVCFREARSVSAELQSFALLGKYFPNSKLAAKATFSSAAAYAGIAYYDRAAELFETYATKYAGEKDALDALQDAIVYRAALGDTAKRIQDTRNYVRTYGARRPKEAASAMYALVSAYDGSPDDAIKQLRDFLATFAKHDDELAILAHARLGDLLWARSCPIPAIDGLCMSIVRDKPSAQCGADRVLKVVPVKRAPTATQALDEYKEAIALFGKASRSPGGTHAAAMATLALADAELEHMLLDHLPTDLDFDPAPAHEAAKERSLKRFGTWVETETRSAAAVSKQYADVLVLKDFESSIASAARIGQTAEAFWRALLVGEIPRSIKAGAFAKDKLAAYCDNMRTVSEPLAARAAEAFQLCLAKSAELNAGHAWANVCEREGHLVAPDKFPDAQELYATPGPSSFTPVVLEPPLR